MNKQPARWSKIAPDKNRETAPQKDHSMSIFEAAVVKDATVASRRALRSDGCKAAMIKGQVFAHAAVSTSTTTESLRSGTAR
jgi:hypothetical protein